MGKSTRAFLLKVLRDDMNLDVEDALLTDDLPLGSSGLDLESIGFTELALHAETQLGVRIPDRDLGTISGYTVRQFTDYLDDRLPGGTRE